MEPQMHQIGEVADAVGLSLRTIRYYEEAELVLPSGRSTGGFRLYTEGDIDRLRLVKQMKPLDLTIEEMRDLLTVRDRLADSATPKREREALLERLAMFAELAEERCQRLREQLEAGEQLSATLRTEARAAGTAGRARR
jgi:MerR family copper efflux transcriptional regulator